MRRRGYRAEALRAFCDQIGVSKSEQWIVDEFIKYNGRSSDNYDPEGDPYAVSVPEGQSARAALGAVRQ